MQQTANIFSGVDKQVRVARSSTFYMAHLGLLERMLDGRTVDGLFAVAMNTDPYTYLGSRSLSLLPELDLDGPLGLVNLHRLGLASLLRAVASAARGGGRLARLRNVDVIQPLEALVVRGHRPFPWQVDGDHLGDTERLELHHEREVLSVVVPLARPRRAPSD